MENAGETHTFNDYSFDSLQYYNHLLQWGRTFQYDFHRTRQDLDTKLEYRQDAQTLSTQAEQ
jgi:hypothetical protein